MLSRLNCFFPSGGKSSKRKKKSSSAQASMQVAPKPQIIIPLDDKPCKGSGFKDPIEIDDEVEILGVMRVGSGSSPGNPIIVEQEGPRGPTTHLNPRRVGKSVIDIGEASSSRTTFRNLLEIELQFDFICDICTELNKPSEKFSIEGCYHTYCKSCIGQYVASKVELNRLLIKCPSPDCESGKVEPLKCLTILKPEVFDRWCMALCEALVDDKFYCPFQDCSALMVNDSVKKVTQAQCPHCNRLFCAQCRVPWHGSYSCSDMQNVLKGHMQMEDLMLMKVAEEKKWQRCPKCKFYVEKTTGCMFMKCRCGFTFCYGCAKEMVINHYCAKCRR